MVNSQSNMLQEAIAVSGIDEEEMGSHRAQRSRATFTPVFVEKRIILDNKQEGAYVGLIRATHEEDGIQIVLCGERANYESVFAEYDIGSNNDEQFKDFTSLGEVQFDTCKRMGFLQVIPAGKNPDLYSVRAKYCLTMPIELVLALLAFFCNTFTSLTENEQTLLCNKYYPIDEDNDWVVRSELFMTVRKVYSMLETVNCEFSLELVYVRGLFSHVWLIYCSKVNPCEKKIHVPIKALQKLSKKYELIRSFFPSSRNSNEGEFYNVPLCPTPTTEAIVEMFSYPNFEAITPVSDDTEVSNANIPSERNECHALPDINGILTSSLLPEMTHGETELDILQRIHKKSKTINNRPKTPGSNYDVVDRTMLATIPSESSNSRKSPVQKRQGTKRKNDSGNQQHAGSKIRHTNWGRCDKEIEVATSTNVTVVKRPVPNSLPHLIDKFMTQAETFKLNEEQLEKYIKHVQNASNDR